MAGESAQREYERLRERRHSFLRDRFWILLALTAVLAIVLGALAHAYLDMWWLGPGFAAIFVAGKLAPTQRERAFARGAEGERIVGSALDRLEGDTVRVLHDRLIPGSRANIDHILVSTCGVWTVDAKRYTGRIEARRRGSELWINKRNRSKFLDQSDRQVAVIREILTKAGLRDVPVRGALCFTRVDWPWLFPPREVRGVRILPPKRLADLASGDQRSVDVRGVIAVLERTLRPAVDTGQASTDPEPKRPPEPPRPAPASARDEYFATPGAAKVRDAQLTCECGAEMVERRRRKDGQPFWGCSSFPTCRRTRAMT
jgi:hypothetical protein